MGKSLSSDSARAPFGEAARRSLENVQRRTRGSASLPSLAERLGPIISTVHTNDSTLTRNKGLLVSPFLELFLDRSARIRDCVQSHQLCELMTAANEYRQPNKLPREARLGRSPN
jgi:hypothetical protein